MLISKEDNKVLIDNFNRTMKNVLSVDDYNLLEKRLENVIINFTDDVTNREDEISGCASGIFNPLDRTITIYDKEDRVVYHELLHLSSLRYCTDSICYSGFRHQDIKNKKYSGSRGLDEGYTELLTVRYFGGKNSYENETFYSQMIENVVGKDKMQSFYFNSDVDGLISELSKYCDKEKVLNFMDKMDYFIILDLIREDKHKKYKELSMEAISEYVEINHKQDETMDELNEFLIECYANKYGNSPNTEEIKSSLLDYISVHYNSHRLACTGFDLKSQIDKSFRK